jgi:hypothetical protein
MASEKDRWLARLEGAKIIFGMVAVLVGGYWTYLKFIRTEAPLFERTTKVNWYLSDPVDEPEGCSRYFNVYFMNSGKSVLSVTKVLTRGWKFYFRPDNTKFAKLLDTDEIETQDQPVFEKQFPDPKFEKPKGKPPWYALLRRYWRDEEKSRWYPFLGTYRPGEEYSHTFVLLFKKEQDAWIFLKTEIFIEGETKPKVVGGWGAVCGPKAGMVPPQETDSRTG